MDLRSLADEDLVPLMARGDARAFAVIYERHSVAAYSLAYRMVGSRIAAEDVAQEAFLGLWRSGARYDSRRGSVRAWILDVVHQRAIDGLRRATVHDRRRAGGEESERAAGLLEAPERTDAEAARRDEAATVRAAIETLPADQVHVIELAYFGGFTDTEIAEILQAPVGAIKGRMRLALRRLRDALGEGAVLPG